MRRFVITMDGPAGVGKSTLARALAGSLGIPVLDTGAMYRCVALHLGREGLELTPEELEKRLRGLSFDLSGSGTDAALSCNGKIPGNEIRNEDVGALASAFAALAPVREFLKAEQRKIGRSHSLVAEGRDMGTVIFPDASHKFFLDATPEVRAERRYLQLREQGQNPDLETLTRQIRKRDEQDRNRSLAPLLPAPDAIIVDTSGLTPSQVLEIMLSHVQGPVR